MVYIGSVGVQGIGDLCDVDVQGPCGVDVQGPCGVDVRWSWCVCGCQ